MYIAREPSPSPDLLIIYLPHAHETGEYRFTWYLQQVTDVIWPDLAIMTRLMVSSGYDDGSCYAATKMKALLTTKNRMYAFTGDTRQKVRVSRTEVTGDLLPQIVEHPTTAVASPSENQHTHRRM